MHINTSHGDITEEPPLSPSDGTLWFDELDAQLRVYVNGEWLSIADKYVLRSGDEVTGVINYSSSLFINEGGGDTSVGSDIRATGDMLLSADNDIMLSYDNDNNGTG